MKVKITKGKHWYEGMEGEIFEVFEDHIDNEDHDPVYSLVEDLHEMTVRYIEPMNCVLVPLAPDAPTELTRLRAELERTQAALDAAGELITLSDAKFYTDYEGLAYCEDCSVELSEEIIHTEDCQYRKAKQAFTAALAAARGTETG